MKVGIYAPQMRDSPDAAFRVADAAERSGLNGVFCFDHLWGPNLQPPSPPRPMQSCFPLLGALAARTTSIVTGSLVARVGITSNDELVNAFEALRAVAGSRLIAGLGAGDSGSRGENEAYGIPFPPFLDRVALLEDAVVRLRALDITVWVGGRSAAIRDVGERQHVPVNQWDAPVSGVQPGDTWGGPFRSAEQIRQLRDAGATWSVFLVEGSGNDPKGSVERLSAALQ